MVCCVRVDERFIAEGCNTGFDSVISEILFFFYCLFQVFALFCFFLQTIETMSIRFLTPPLFGGFFPDRIL